jgi:UDP-glucose 4-epimerase
VLLLFFRSDYSIAITQSFVTTYERTAGKSFFKKSRGVMRTILVTGGAGYIGSHIVEQLAARGDRVLILDSLVYGQPWPTLASPVTTGTILCMHGQCGDAALLDSLFSQFSIDAVIHCAALIEVGASVKEPLSFYATNVSQTLTLLDRMKAHGINTIIFSSSAAVYGNPGVDLISENAPTVPLNPYGQSKLFIERVLADCATAYGLRYAVLRYFNVAGAYPEQQLGERHQPETHVAPLLLRAAVAGTPFNLYSADYGTTDGTCIRDYVHVRDIARANVLALDALCPRAQNSEAESLKDVSVDVDTSNPSCPIKNSKTCCMSFASAKAHTGSFTLNIGSGKGLSVLDLVHEVERVTAKTIATRVVERRAGDAASLVADATQAKNILGWQPHYTIQEMVRDAHIFHSQEVSEEVCANKPSFKDLER